MNVDVMFHSSQSRSDEPERQQERVTNTAAHNNRFYITDTDLLFFFYYQFANEFVDRGDDNKENMKQR